MADLEQVVIESREQWRAWLEENHESAPGVWLVTWKKDSGRPNLPYDDIVEEALCFGWVDSQPRSLDKQRSQLRVTPRKATSSWSRVNKQRVERLVTVGLMRPAGIAAVELARSNGSWTALDDVEDLVEPDELTAALDSTPGARVEWDAFPRSTKRAILEWIGSAKRDETRTKRIVETASQAAKGIRANQWRQPKGR